MTADYNDFETALFEHLRNLPSQVAVRELVTLLSALAQRVDALENAKDVK